MQRRFLKITVPVAVLLSVASVAHSNPGKTDPGGANPGIPAASAHSSASGQTKSSMATTTANRQLTTQGALSAKVQERLQADDRLRDLQIQTDINGKGSVLLRGTVDNDEQRRAAEEIVSGVAGVSGIRNELQVPKGE